MRMAETRESEGKVKPRVSQRRLLAGEPALESSREGFVEQCTHCKFSCMRVTGMEWTLFAAIKPEWSQGAKSSACRVRSRPAAQGRVHLRRPRAVWYLSIVEKIYFLHDVTSYSGSPTYSYSTGVAFIGFCCLTEYDSLSCERRKRCSVV